MTFDGGIFERIVNCQFGEHLKLKLTWLSGVDDISGDGTGLLQKQEQFSLTFTSRVGGGGTDEQLIAAYPTAVINEMLATPPYQMVQDGFSASVGATVLGGGIAGVVLTFNGHSAPQGGNPNNHATLEYVGYVIWDKRGVIAKNVIQGPLVTFVVGFVSGGGVTFVPFLSSFDGRLTAVSS